MNIYYQHTHNRLVYLGNASNQAYWDKHWNADNFEACLKTRQNPFVVGHTQRYLPKGTAILEGGCGRGDKVYALQANGYNAYGIDFAQATIQKIKRYAPEIEVSVGDVRALSFPDQSFDGYWSIGVIEHFYQGYEPIMNEMYRVLKYGGYLFLTVPSLSTLRKIKTLLNLYPHYNEQEADISQFYQFILPPENIIRSFTRQGFRLVTRHPYGGLKGVKDEVAWLRPILQRVYEGTSFQAKAVGKLINLLTTRGCGHVMLYIFQKASI